MNGSAWSGLISDAVAVNAKFCITDIDQAPSGDRECCAPASSQVASMTITRFPEHAHPFYSCAALVREHRLNLQYARSFPPGSERNQHLQIAASIKSLLNNREWVDSHTVESCGIKLCRSVDTLHPATRAPAARQRAFQSRSTQMRYS
jgi:hypothetical protein